MRDPSNRRAPFHCRSRKPKAPSTHSRVGSRTGERGVFEQDRADEPGDGGFVGKDPDDVGAALDLAVEALEPRELSSLR